MFRIDWGEGCWRFIGWVRRWLSRGSWVNNDGGKGSFAFGGRDWPFDPSLVRWLRLCRWSRQSTGRMSTCVWSSIRRLSRFKRFLHWLVFDFCQRKELLCNLHFAEGASINFFTSSIKGETVEVETLLSIHQSQNPSKNRGIRNGVSRCNLLVATLLQSISPAFQDQCWQIDLSFQGHVVKDESVLA